MKKSLALSFLLLASTVACAKDKPHTTRKPQPQNLNFQNVLKQQGFVWLQDSGSNYVFQSDGTFQSAPLGMSGRTLQGFWTQQGSFHTTQKSQIQESSPIVEVEAIRSWENGVSVNDDFRKISFYIGDSGTLEKRAMWLDGTRKNVSVYETYWFVDSLEPMGKPKNWDAHKSKLSHLPFLLTP